MKLTSMKMTKADREKRTESAIGGPDKDAPAYPWGLSITLDEEALTKLGMDTLPKTDTPMMLLAKVDVTSVSSNQVAGGGERRSVSLQLTDLALGDVDDAPADKKLYGKE